MMNRRFDVYVIQSGVGEVLLRENVSWAELMILKQEYYAMVRDDYAAEYEISRIRFWKKDDPDDVYFLLWEPRGRA